MKIKVNKNEALFFLYYLIFQLRFFLSSYINISLPSVIESIFNILVVIFFLLNLITKKYTIKEAVICMTTILFALSVSYFSKEYIILITILTITIMKDIPVNKAIAMDFSIKVMIIMSTLALNSLGIIESYKVYRITESGMTIRNSLGFSHPNVLGIIVAITIMDYVYLRYRKLRIRSLIILMMITVTINAFADSRTAFYSTLFLLCMVFITRYIAKVRAAFLYLGEYFITISAVISIVFSLLYKREGVIAFFDRLLTDRFYYGNLYYKLYGVSLFGKEINLLDNIYKDSYYITLDNFYMRLIINFGIVTFILYLAAFFKLCRTYKSNKTISKLLMIVFFAIYSISESNGLNPCFNSSILFIAELIFTRVRNGGGMDGRTYFCNSSCVQNREIP